MRWLSLRARIVLISAVLLTVGLTAATLTTLDALRGPLERQVDSQIHGAADALSQIPQEVLDLATTAPPGAKRLPTVQSELVTNTYLAFVDASGRPLAGGAVLSPAGIPGPDLPTLDAAAVAAHGDELFNVPALEGSATWRVLAQHRPNGGSIVVAASMEQLYATLAGVWTRCLLVGGGLLVVLIVIGWFWVRAGLRPLRRIEQTSAAIASGDFTRRVPDLAAPNTEIGRLATALNGMLAQIESAVAARAGSEQRLLRFVADASHELRTPLAGIGGFAQLYLMGGESDVDQTMARIERESARLGKLVEDLLLLTQLDEHTATGGVLNLHREPMDLRTLAADAWHDLKALDPSRPVQLSGPAGGPPGAAPVSGDEDRLRQVVTNLVGNVIEHTPQGSAVRLGVGTVNGDAILEFSDTGPGLAVEHQRQIFERFYRADRSRARPTGTTSGAGLGLSIVWSLMAAHGGTVELDSVVGRGTTFRIKLPALRPADS